MVSKNFPVRRMLLGVPTNKAKTLEQLEQMRQKAVRFLRDVVGDDDKAEEFNEMTPEEYAEHKGVEIAANPKRRRMPTSSRPTRAELEERIEDLEQENAELNDKLDSIVDIAGSSDEEDGDEEEEE